MSANFLPRMLMSIAGIYIMTIGIALSCIADLGTSPISSVPWVISLFTDYTVGETTIILNLLMIVVQPVLLRQLYYWELGLQIFTTFFFGSGIDFSMKMLAWLQPHSLLQQWAICFASIVILALGVFLAVNAKVFMAAGEGIVSVLAFVTKKKFSLVKNAFDISLVIVSVVMSVYNFGFLKGVGLGAIVAAIGVGRCVQFYMNHIHLIDKWKAGGAG